MPDHMSQKPNGLDLAMRHAKIKTTTGDATVTDVIVWLIVLGLALALIGLYALWNEMKEHRRDTAEIMLQSNEMMLEQLKRLSPALDIDSATATVLLERRQLDRRRHTASVLPWPREKERRKSPGRRAHDLAYVHQLRH